jgi:Ser/Thr protein kinase RdoA (MazF antagonist)
MSEASRSDTEFGLIHADMRAANLIVEGGELVGLIDFDDCGYGWYVYDAVTMLSFFETDSRALRILNGWFKGYARIGRVGDAALRLMPTLVLFRRMLLLAWLESHPYARVPGLIRSRFGFDTARLAVRYLRHPDDVEYLLALEG